MYNDFKSFIEFTVGWLLLSLVISFPIMWIFNAWVVNYTENSMFIEMTWFAAWGMAILPALCIVIYQDSK